VAWAWVYLLCSVVGGLFVVNAYHPVRRPPWSGLSFFAGWPTSELPLWHIGWQAVATAGFVAAGAWRFWPGWLAAAVTLAGWAGLVGLARQGLQAGAVLDRVLAEAAVTAPPRAGDLPATGRDTMWRLPRLLYPLPRPARVVRVVRHVDYVGDGARSHRLDVIVRRQDPPRAGAPVLVYLHGGAWVFGDKREQGLPMLHELARRGWVTVTVNYGLGPRQRWPAQVVDAKRAVAWVKDTIDRYGGDPGRVVVSGGSAGGHLASLLALTAGDRSWQPGFEEADTSVAACVSFYGVYDFTGGGADPAADRALLDLLERLVFPVRRRDDPELYRLASPIHRVGADAPPFFVIHGTNDTLVPVGEARRFVDALRAVSQAPVVYAELPGTQHAFDVLPSPRGAHTIAAVVRFLAAVLTGRVHDETERSPVGPEGRSGGGGR
jgi:acetyl esterase/lipase